MINIIDNVLTPSECDELIKLGVPQLKTATTLGENISGYRTAEGSWIFEETPLTEKVQQIISVITGTPKENQESIHVVKYEIGGEYKEHHDYFPPNQSYTEHSLGTAGQRTTSCLFYLNDDFKGGETLFPIKNIKITPRKGRLLIWSNIDKNGVEDGESLHAGLPVIEGTKYIVIIWIREKRFQNKPIPKKISKPKIIENVITPISITPNHFDLGKILDEDECERLTKLILSGIQENQFHLETDKRYYNNSYGGNINESWELLNRFKPLVEKKIGRGIKPANPYIRVYKNGSTLNKHTDRVGLDWTISICLYTNLKEDWPLIVKNKNGRLKKYPTMIGYGSLVSGNILEHWREPLKCKKNEQVIQIFLHYTECGCRPGG